MSDENIVETETTVPTEPTKLIVDLSLPEDDPNRVQVVPLTEEELSEIEARSLEFKQQEEERKAAEEAAALARESAEAKLAALGLTPEEIAALKG